tara:strand:+ start:143 stop:1042 length:900 start_codon:yes stop_codon:yes gene_type:complete
MNYISKNKIPISCLCSIYKYTKSNEFLLSIKSLLLQKYIPSEIIIMIDGPINNKLQKNLDCLLKKYPNLIRRKVLNKNFGLGSSLREGIKLCKNELIARFDTDDINLKDRLVEQYQYFKNDRELIILGSYIKEFNYLKNNKIFSRIKKVPLLNESIYKFLNKRNPINHPTVMFRKSSILKAGSYSDMDYFEDYYLWLRCKKMNYKFLNIATPLVAMKRKDNLDRRHGLIYAYKEILFLKSCFKENIISTNYIFIFRLIIRLLPKFLSELILKFDRSRKTWQFDYELGDYVKNIKDQKIF